MRNSIIAIFLAGLAGNACAEWTVTDKNGVQTSYADIDNILHSGNTVKMWTLIDLVKLKIIDKEQGYLSSLLLYEFDCTELRARVVQGSAYEGHMRSGARIFNDNTPWEWEYVQPNTIKDGWLKIACNKKK
jgi:hypothetical protein